jgi:hypothetical protein
MVIYGFLTARFDFRAIVPDTRKITVLGPSDSIAARKLPGPLSLRFVTKITLPPRPPIEAAPNPSAPGKAGIETAVCEMNKVVMIARKAANTRCIIF